jgi:hypothetical protein
MHDQDYLNYYFSQVWKPGKNRGPSDPENIAKLIHNNEWVLDVGCGSNPFKEYLDNVVGIDPASDNADIKTTIENYFPDRLFDVATCLGSINFGSEEIISKQIDMVVKCLKPKSRIYWRLNPGRQDHSNTECENIDFFPWTLEKLAEYATKYGYRQHDVETESYSGKIRFYAVWER